MSKNQCQVPQETEPEAALGGRRILDTPSGSTHTGDRGKQDWAEGEVGLCVQSHKWHSRSHRELWTWGDPEELCPTRALWTLSDSQWMQAAPREESPPLPPESRAAGKGVGALSYGLSAVNILAAGAAPKQGPGGSTQGPAQTVIERKNNRKVIHKAYVFRAWLN